MGSSKSLCFVFVLASSLLISACSSDGSNPVEPPERQDLDIDGDGLVNIEDADVDGDGLLNSVDPDIDGDGIANDEDSTPLGAFGGSGAPPAEPVEWVCSGDSNTALPVVETDLVAEAGENGSPGESCFPDPEQDIDSDGTPDWQDLDIDGDGVVNSEDPDVDGDGLSNSGDPDIDGDGIANSMDGAAFGGLMSSAPPRFVQFFYDPNTEHGGQLFCNGVAQEKIVPTSCALGASGLTISRERWDGKEALLAENGEITGACGGSVVADISVTGAYQLTPTCTKPVAKDPEPRQDASGAVLVDEWFTDLPWHQKLSTLDSNVIDVPFVLPFAALPRTACPSAVTPTDKARCMLRYGIVNVMAMHRTDTRYKAGEADEGQDCGNNKCVEVKFEVQRLHTLTNNAEGYAADTIRNNEYEYPSPTAPGKTIRVPSLGFAITEATIFAPWRPWYMGHYCGVDRADYIDAVCYDDYFTTQLQAPADSAANQFWLRDYPAIFEPQGTKPGYTRFCQSRNTSCSMFLGKVDWLLDASEPQVVGCIRDGGQSEDPLEKCQDEVNASTQRLDAQFNKSLSQYSNQGRYPWAESPDNNPGAAIATNPSIGFYKLERFEESGGGSIPSSQFRAPGYVLPRECSKMDFAEARRGSSAAIGRLKNCAVNFEIHTSGFHEIWKELYGGGELEGSDVEEISRVLPGFEANQYGRTMFMYAGVAEQKLPVSFRLLDDGMSIFDKMYGSSVYTQYLPMVNPADHTLATRSYGNNFWHAFFMSNHMNQTPDHFIRGIRGRTLWHNEYRSKIMYQSAELENKDKNTRFEGTLEHVDFPAGFQVANQKSPFHGNTCDSCHIRNGSGIPLMPNGKLPKIHVDRGMDEIFKINGRDYTYTNRELPSMKMVLFDPTEKSGRLEQCDVAGQAMPGSAESPPDQYYSNKVMNFYGNSFHVNQSGGLPTYNMAYTPITDDSGFEVVADEDPRKPQGRDAAYQPMRVEISGIRADLRCKSASDIKANPGVDDSRWPASCADVSGDAVGQAIASGEIGFMHLLGRRLGNTPLIEMIPDQTILAAQRAQRTASTINLAGCYGLTAGTRRIKPGASEYRRCETKKVGASNDDCYISRWGWIGDRASLEDQIANAAVVEMNITSKEGDKAIHENEADPGKLVRYSQALCGPADASCSPANANSDVTEQEIADMATYQRWIGIPQRSEYQVSSAAVQRGEKIFKDELQCSSCHVIGKIPFVEYDNMLPDEERASLRKLQTQSGGAADYPFVSYLGTDLLRHDMGYLSQVARAPADVAIRNEIGTVKEEYTSYVQRIRTPALKGLRFNRFVTDSNHNAKTGVGCDFLLHDGRACDAIEAAYLHDGPAVKDLGMIGKLNNLSTQDLKALRAFLYSL